MARNRKCILCETVHVSKQEMDEHMRSMLHHRELEKVKGRDCGHECRVCKVTVASLTDYASHISSPGHKQNVEAVEQDPGRSDHGEEYFDKAMVELIEKRKEQMRKEKEAAAAKLAKEEEDRRKKEEFQQRIKEAKERYKLDGDWQHPSKGFERYNQPRNHQYNAAGWEARPWINSRQGKSATWHAQAPPNFRQWASGDLHDRSWHAQESWGNSQWEQGAFPGNHQGRMPWLSNGGSNYGVYGRNNISHYPQKKRPQTFGPASKYPPMPCFFASGAKQSQNTGNGLGGQQGDGLQSGEIQSAACENNSSKSSKTFGSNPKLDKACRWSPYPVTKGFDSMPHKDAPTNSSEKYPKVPQTGKQEKAPEASALNRHSRPQQKPQPPTSCGQSLEEKGKPNQNPKTTPTSRSSSGSRSSSAQRDAHQISSSGASSHNANKQLVHEDRKLSSAPGAQHSKDSSKAQPGSKSSTKQNGIKTPPIGTLQSRQGQKLPEASKKPADVSGKRGSLDTKRLEMALQTVEEKLRDRAQSQIGADKENSCRQNAAKPNLPDSVRCSLGGEGKEKLAFPSLDSSQFLQSLQVSTSTMESSEPAASSKEDQENAKRADKVSCSAAPDEAMQAAEGGPGSESDASRSDDAQTLSGANAPSLAKLDLASALKRDLTKHASSKSKAVGHEPNLNIARRVRNVSESRRSDTEKDSGLKPTVRQLISSSGSRRNVNWEQVYQEVRKKQDKGKGKPRFGIEMVPYDQEDHSQEEDDVPLLEGFHWESLMEVSASPVSRKRSLSESSVAPAFIHSLFPSKESAQREGGLKPEPQGSSISPTSAFDHGNDDQQQQQREVEQMLGLHVAESQKQPDSGAPEAARALQRSDSVLGDSSSGAEQLDGLGTAKRRRAAGDAPGPEASGLEHDNKRRRIKSKRAERSHIDQLLTVSLREEELSRSLQNVDTSLIQARAALEAAYMEVQRLMVVKQQITVEMSSLRSKRIDLLKGMQGTREAAPPLKVKEEKADPEEVEPLGPPSVAPSSAMDPAAASSPAPAARCASPPSSSRPFLPVVIKQEPQSPVRVGSEVDAAENPAHCAHSTTPELPPLPLPPPPPPTSGAASSPDEAPDLRAPPEPHQAKREPESPEEPDDCKEGPAGMITAETASQTTSSCLVALRDCRVTLRRRPASSRESEVASLAESSPNPTFEPPAPPSAPNAPSSPIELRNGKRVRKLKKRRALKKAQGSEQPESSDTEVDGGASRPRWPRPRRRPSGGSQVSTSSLPRDGDVNMEEGKDAAAEPVVIMDLEESMEVAPAPPPTLQLPDSCGAGPHSLACCEVSSTSDMDVCKSSEGDVPTFAKRTRASSDVPSDQCESEIPCEGAFEGHQEAVNAMQIHGGLLYTCSGDRTVKAFDLLSRKCVAVFEGHTSKVSCLLVSTAPYLQSRLYTGSSDQTIRCYGLTRRELEQQFLLSDRVLCLHSRWRVLYAGLANGTVVTFNLKTNRQMDVFECHGPRAVSCLASSQEGARRLLLVGSYDSTISVRDAKNGLLLRTLEGHTKTVLCMKIVSDLVLSGSSDQSVHAHNIHTGKLVRVYKGHSHAVTVVTTLGKVMVTACLDKLVRVYDLQSREQLQVYGGHQDMVTCMTVHKNMIYTGCYDGSIQAVKLNLTQNHRCRWHGCSMALGVMQHLQQHLINDHVGANFQTLKCRWKDCEEHFCARNGSKQGILTHMQKHAEEEAEPEP